MSDKQVQIKITGDASNLSNAAKQGAKDLDHLGNSAKQNSQALRQVPMQFTDIVVSLQAGQSPMQVFLQQGGQLKDLFGGAGNAAKALSTYILGLVSPLTITAAAAAGLGAVFYLGSEQSKRLENALIMSGNAAGKTLGQMDDLAESVGHATGQYGLAREAAEALAASGKISSENIKSALDGVVAGVQVTGQAAEKLVTDFEAIGKDPVAAIKKLNESYNFLTVDVYKQISALEEQGKHQQAVTLATDTFANTMQTRSKEIISNAGLIERSWIGIKTAISGATDAALDFGRAKTDSENIVAAQEKLRQLENGRSAGRAGAIKGTEAEIAQQKALIKELENVKIHRESTADAYAKFQEKQAAQIAATDAAKKYAGSDSSYSKSGLLSHKLQQENDEFNKIIINLKKGSKEYEDVLAAHENRVANIKEAAANKNKNPKDTDYEEQLKQHSESMRDIASLTQATQKLNEGEKSNIQIVQDKLDAYSYLDPALQKYLQSQLDIAKAAEQEANWQKVINEGIDRKIESQNALAEAEKRAADERDKTFQDMADKLVTENEDLNISLIASDKARAKAQVDLEHQRALDRINSLILESDQAQQLIDQETENYNLKLKLVKEGSKDTAKEFGLIFKSTAEEAITNWQGFGNLIQGIAQDIEKMLIRKNVTEPFMNLIDGIDFGSIDFGSLLDFGGGRASGGAVNSGKFYEVNENSPELITTGGKTFLMMGANDGHVTPPASFNGSKSSGQQSTLQSIQVSIENKGSPAQVVSAQPTMTPDGMIVKIMMDDMRSNGPITRGLSGTFGLQRGG